MPDCRRPSPSCCYAVEIVDNLQATGLAEPIDVPAEEEVVIGSWDVLQLFSDPLSPAPAGFTPIPGVELHMVLDGVMASGGEGVDVLIRERATTAPGTTATQTFGTWVAAGTIWQGIHRVRARAFSIVAWNPGLNLEQLAISVVARRG